MTSRSRVRVVGLLLLSLPRRDFCFLLLPGSRKSLRIMDFGKCFRSVTHEGKVPGSIRTSRFHRTPFIDALCVSFSGVGKKKKKKKIRDGRGKGDNRRTHTPPDEMCRRVFPRDTSLTFSFAFVFCFVFSWLLLVDDSQIILFNTIKYYERGKRMKNRSWGGNKIGMFHFFSHCVTFLFVFCLC